MKIIATLVLEIDVDEDEGQPPSEVETFLAGEVGHGRIELRTAGCAFDATVLRYTPAEAS